MATPSSALYRASSRDSRRPSGVLLTSRYRWKAARWTASQAVDRTTGERVFVKFGSRGPRSVSEADFLARLDHPAIVRLKDSGNDTTARSSSWNGSTAAISRPCWPAAVAGSPMSD